MKTTMKLLVTFLTTMLLIMNAQSPANASVNGILNKTVNNNVIEETQSELDDNNVLEGIANDTYEEESIKGKTEEGKEAGSLQEDSLMLDESNTEESIDVAQGSDHSQSKAANSEIVEAESSKSVNTEAETSKSEIAETETNQAEKVEAVSDQSEMANKSDTAKLETSKTDDKKSEKVKTEAKEAKTEVKETKKADAEKKDTSKSTSNKDKTKETKAQETKKEEPSYTRKDVRLLACLVYAEAGNQSYEGMLAVANVVLNRVKSDAYWHVDTIKEVIYDKKWAVQFAVTVKNKKGVSSLDKTLKCFDNWTFTGSNPEAEEKAMRQAIKAARAALEGENNIGDYLCFQNKRDAKRIKKKYPDYKILGDHIFYRTK